MSDIEKTIEKAITLQSLPENRRGEYYDEYIEPELEELIDEFGNSESQEKIGEWLQFQLATEDLAVEGITDVTLELLEANRGEFIAAKDSLSIEQRLRMESLLAGLVPEYDSPLAPEAEMLEGVVEQDQEFLGRLFPFLRNRGPNQARPENVFAQFIGESILQSARRHPIVHGRLVVFDSNGDRAGVYEANTGGGAANYRTRNGPLPPGLYRVSTHWDNRTTRGMVYNGVGYSFHVDPTGSTNVYGRSLFRIHPDGGSVGTNGCIGIRESANELNRCESQIVSLLEAFNGSFRMTVQHP